MTKKEAIEILKSKVCDNSLECNECIGVVVKALENSDNCTNELKTEVEVFKENFNELNSSKSFAEDREASADRKAQVNFMKSHEDYFTKTPIRKCYYETTSYVDAILDNISKLRYDIDRLNEEEYQSCISDIQSNLTLISLKIKALVIHDENT